MTRNANKYKTDTLILFYGIDEITIIILNMVSS